MKLLTKEILRAFPEFGSTEGDSAKVVVKFFTPDSNWTWYATEFDGEDTFYGLVCGHEKELGYFSLAEIKGARGPMGLAIERDMYLGPLTIGEARERG